jgi:mono/diheme cytochrome c family protein
MMEEQAKGQRPKDKAARLAGLACVILLVACSGGTQSETGDPPPGGRYGIGRPATEDEIRIQNQDVGPSGAELPEGKGSVADGAKVYGAKCASCHGLKGEGMPPFPKLIGRDPKDGFPFGRDPALVKTIGNYWPHATTLFDYVKRSMPFMQPGSLSNDEVYAVTAWLLAQNEIIPADATLDAAGLRAVKMPARDRFVRDDRKGGAEVR